MSYREPQEPHHPSLVPEATRSVTIAEPYCDDDQASTEVFHGRFRWPTSRPFENCRLDAAVTSNMLQEHET